MFGWLKKSLGITYLDERLQRLEKLDHFTLSDVADKLSSSFIILADDDQRVEKSVIEIPFDKSGILCLGQGNTVRDCYMYAQPYRIIKEPVSKVVEK